WLFSPRVAKKSPAFFPVLDARGPAKLLDVEPIDNTLPYDAARSSAYAAPVQAARAMAERIGLSIPDLKLMVSPVPRGPPTGRSRRVDVETSPSEAPEALVPEEVLRDEKGVLENRVVVAFLYGALRLKGYSDKGLMGLGFFPDSVDLSGKSLEE